MASTPNHAVQGALITLLIGKFLAWVLITLFPFFIFLISPVTIPAIAILLSLGAVAGAAPDIIGWLGKMVTAWSWEWYNAAHDGEIAKRLVVIPPYGLHLLADLWFHTPENGPHWWPREWWKEGLLWLVNGAVIWWLVT